MTQKELFELGHALRETMRTASTFITDPAKASKVPILYPYWSKDKWPSYKLDTIVRKADDTLWKFNLPSLADASQNREPGTAGTEALWSRIEYYFVDDVGYRVIPDIISSTVAFKLNELGYWHGDSAAPKGIYKSGQAGLSYPPGTVGAPWTLTIDLLGGAEEGSEEPTEEDEFPIWTPWDGLNEHLKKIGDKTTHKGQRWISTADNNHWEPGVFGWVVYTG